MLQLCLLEPVFLSCRTLEYGLPMDSDELWVLLLPMRRLTIQRAEIDIDYLDSVSLALSTAVLINFPRPRFAVLPVSLGVELVSIGGTVSQLPKRKFRRLS